MDQLNFYLNKIQQPTTMLTDFMITYFAFRYGRDLLKTNLLKNKTVFYWALAFFAIGLSSLAGGVYHGFAEILSKELLGDLWLATMYLIGVVSFLMVYGSMKAVLSNKYQFWLGLFLIIKLIFYIYWISINSEFIFAILEYLPSMVFVLGLNFYTYFKRRRNYAKYFIIAVLISFFAVGVQMSGIGFHKYFNHNDIYHIIQIVGLYYFYRGNKKLEFSYGISL